MGQPLARVDGRLKVMGRANYPADIPVNNLAHGLLVASGIARGRVQELHLDEAHAVKGVLDILTHDHIRGELEPPEFGTSGSSSIGPLHDDKIWHDGQIIALVIAETIEAAREAAMRITVDYKEEQPSTSFGSEGTETVAASEVSQQFKEDVKAGDFETAFDAAEVKIDVEYGMPTHHHNPIEMFSTTAYWQGEELTVHEPTQNVYGWKVEIARQLKIEPDRVRVISPYIGGAFGSKGPITPRTAIVALAARRLGRPVRCVVTRSQSFTTQTYRAETRHHIQMAAARDGRITAFKHEGWEVTSRPDPYVVGGTKTTGRLYNYGSVLTKVFLVKTDRPTPSYMRAPAETPYIYALENAMDEMAVALNMDPVEFRRVNDASQDAIEGKPFSSRSLMQCYDEAASEFGWSKRNPQVGSMRDGDWLIGMGCATAVHPANVAPCAVRITLRDDGHARVQTASHEIGTGVQTVAAQLAAEHLGLHPSMVQVEMGDTRLPPAPVTGGSSTTASVCSAIIKACEEIREKLARAAVTANDGPLAGRDPASVLLKNGRLVAADASQALKDVFKHVGSGVIEQYTEFRPDGASPDAVSNLYQGKMEMVSGEKGDMIKYAFGAEFVEVRIHRRTREIRVPRVVGAFSGGRIMNTRTARSQLMGGMIWGISSALHEATEFDWRSARVVNRDLQDYLVPVNADIQDVKVILVPETDTHVNLAGVKGLGELGNVGTAAAIASAVHHATGKRIRELPIRIDNLLG
ncbi:xanthine dehydrogenase family protein molybdopterin-binding subunit (plasmid) [Rhizobium sp. 32-5/1]|uniref:xanthine dehydrogenase family protein molybdopterin-binding subunit n=1 Tax=Rhizobium sp. 32-5/1 TaxID=3019602 RepID=UPI00240E9771|nr:xanthine dehydrogenase family protein molybdopterin-binding subunit [Rhizobium sp. 32-5/1]WEZ85453.1 xanthine dehydrogenase family protein molybdopterin-binding subunit [Rhizobium sp. 32-5/1]